MSAEKKKQQSYELNEWYRQMTELIEGSPGMSDDNHAFAAIGLMIVRKLGNISAELYHLRGELHDLQQELRAIEKNTR